MTYTVSSGMLNPTQLNSHLLVCRYHLCERVCTYHRNDVTWPDLCDLTECGLVILKYGFICKKNSLILDYERCTQS